MYIHEAFKDKQPVVFKAPPKISVPTKISRYVTYRVYISPSDKYLESYKGMMKFFSFGP